MLKTTWLCLTSGDLNTELLQLQDEGKDISSVANEFKKLMTLTDDESCTPENQNKIQNLLIQSQQLPTKKDYPFNEPSTLCEIRKLNKPKIKKFKNLSQHQLLKHIHGAWLGRCSGCLLGKASEGIKSQTLWNYLKDSKQFPLKNYIKYKANKKLIQKYPDIANRAWADALQYMPVDDDTNYTLTGVLIVNQFGKNFTPADVAFFWTSKIPLLSTCTAERVAYRNFALLIPPPQSATHLNPYREWIGAQIRADGFAYTTLGNPELATDFTWRDASISHIKNGIYGEMFIAAMIASAPFADSIEELIEIGLSFIPKTSRLHKSLMEVIDWKKSGLTYEDALKKIHSTWDENTGHHWCHTISNALICTVALLWGNDNFEDSICKAVYACFDTDCNGATVGSILGMRHGADKLPSKWTSRLNDTLFTSIESYNKVCIEEVAKLTASVHKKLNV